jgi:hypothetical protein
MLTPSTRGEAITAVTGTSERSDPRSIHPAVRRDAASRPRWSRERGGTRSAAAAAKARKRAQAGVRVLIVS